MLNGNYPDRIVLEKLTEQQCTKPGDVMLCSNHFYPVSNYGIPAQNFDMPIYREVTEGPAA